MNVYSEEGEVETKGTTDSNGTFALFVAGLALLVSMGALLAVAFKLNDDHRATMMAVRQAQPTGAGAQSGTGTKQIKMIVKSDEEHGKKGPEGSWHDAVLPADFSVKPGTLVEVTVYNYDEGDHSFTSPGLGTEAIIAAGSESRPAVTTFSFRAPQNPGKYSWFCAIPCDPWAMGNDGFMRGVVTVA